MSEVNQKRARAKSLFLLPLVFSALFFSGCPQILQKNPGGPAAGFVTVYFEGPGPEILMPRAPAGGGARSLLPGAPTSGFDRYVITFSSGTVTISVDSAINGHQQKLDAGTWNVTVDGYIGPNKAASGTKSSIEVTDYAAPLVTVTLSALPMTGAADSGIFEWNIDTSGITTPETITSADITLRPLPSGSDITIDLLDKDYLGSRDDIPAGMYQVTIQFTREDGKKAGKNVTAHIYPRLTTTAALRIRLF
jgi:hypothetical protein